MEVKHRELRKRQENVRTISTLVNNGGGCYAKVHALDSFSGSFLRVFKSPFFLFLPPSPPLSLSEIFRVLSIHGSTSSKQLHKTVRIRASAELPGIFIKRFLASPTCVVRHTPHTRTHAHTPSPEISIS